MKRTSLLLRGLAGLALALLLARGTAVASCSNAAGTTHGPFAYNPTSLASVPFTNGLGGPYLRSFTVTAPNDGTFFPGQGQNHGQCLTSADADFKVFEIEMVAQDDTTDTGIPLDPPLPIDPNSTLYATLAGAFSFNPATGTFTPGLSIPVDVTISSPGFGNFGHYKVKLGAQARGAGIGVGPGTIILLSLIDPPSDTIPPTVSVTCPGNGSTKLLGVIPVCVTAQDEASGIVSMDASVSSAGGIAVSNQAIQLTPNPGLPVSGTTLVTATGSFTPTGGAPTAGPGTSLGQAFFFNSASDKSLSGNGTYTLTASATDGAGNTGTGTSTFKVEYNVSFTQQDGIPNGGNANSSGKFKFTAHRGLSTQDGASDGAFMYDTTVRVELRRFSDGALLDYNEYGTGDVKDFVKITTPVLPGTPFYETHFRRGALAGPPAAKGSLLPGCGWEPGVVGHQQCCGLLGRHIAR